MSRKYLMFDNTDLDHITNDVLYEVTAEAYSLFEIEDDNGNRLDISKSDSIYDYEVIESYQVPDNISYWEPATDNVNKTSHYNQGDIETIDYLKDTLSKEQYEGFCRGNVLKYLSRYPHKNGVEDLNKAKTYLEWLIESVKE